MSVNFLLKRTSTADKRPTAAQLSVGELALNYEAGDPGVYFEASDGSVRKIGPVTVGGTAPNTNPAGSSGNSVGELWLDNSGGDNVLKVYDGSDWQTASSANVPAGGSTTQVQFNSSGALTGDANFTFDADNDILSVTTVDGALDGPVVFSAVASQNLTKGQIVYIDGISGNIPTVDLARANSSATMPAFGVVSADISSGATGTVVSFGQVGNLDTSTPGFSLGETLYVSATNAGELVNTAPTGEANLIQNVGRVERVHQSVGRIAVVAVGRSNATPNLDDGKIFIGNGSNQAVSSTLTAALSAQAGISSSANAVAVTIDSSGDTTLSGSLAVNSELTVGTTGSPFQASATNDVVTKSYADATYAAGTFGIQAHASFDASAGAAFDWSTDKIAEGNITSVSRTAEGKFTVTFDTDFSSANYTAVCSAGGLDHAGITAGGRTVSVLSRSAGSMDIVVERADDAANDDCEYISIMVIGTLS